MTNFYEITKIVFNNWELVPNQIVSNNVLIFKAQNFSFRVILDRIQIFIDIASVLQTEWFDLEVVVDCINNSKESGGWLYNIPKGMSVKESFKTQSLILFDTLNKYETKIDNYFYIDILYEQRIAELKEFRKVRSEKRWGKLIKK